MIAQIQLLDVDDHDAAIQQIEKNKLQSDGTCKQPTINDDSSGRRM